MHLCQTVMGGDRASMLLLVSQCDFMQASFVNSVHCRRHMEGFATPIFLTEVG